MSKWIEPKSDQLNADSLISGPRIITVTGVRGTDASDQPVAVSYEGDDGKPYKPCKSMRRVMVYCWGKDARTYVGKSMELYCDPDVQFGGMKVGGIRISRMSDIDAKKSMALTATRGKKGLFTVQPLAGASAPPAVNVSAELEALRALARPGNMTALQDKWQSMGAEARRALASELFALKAACEAQPEASDDVSFDAGPTETQQTGADYDGV